MNSLAYKSPIVVEIVSRIIMRAELEKLRIEERHILNTDLVPRVSERIIFLDKGLSESILQPQKIVETQKEILPVQKPFIVTKPVAQEIKPIPQKTIVPQGYGRINGLMYDPFVSYIECSGANTPVKVIKSGQNQITNTFLSKEEIQGIFSFVSERTRIPVNEGVFRVVVDGNLFNGIVSEVIGSKFIIKKNVQVSVVQ